MAELRTPLRQRCGTPSWTLVRLLLARDAEQNDPSTIETVSPQVKREVVTERYAAGGGAGTLSWVMGEKMLGQERARPSPRIEGGECVIRVVNHVKPEIRQPL